MKNKMFLVAVLATLAFAMFSQSDFPLFLLGFEIALEIALIVWTRTLRRYIDKTMSPPAPQAMREQEIPLEISLANRCSFPVSEVKVEVKCRDEYSGKVERLRGTAMLDGKDETMLRFILQTRHYGLLTVWPEQIQIGDPLGINFAVSRFPKQLWEVAVLPELVEAQDQPAISGMAKRPIEEGEAAYGRGEDPSSAYELRAYQEGESLRNVHWKVTAKTDELMVKEFGKETEPMSLVFLDLDQGGKAYSRKDWDAFLEMVASFGAAQIQAGNHFEIFWLDSQAQRCFVQVRTKDDMKLALTTLLREKPRSASAGEIAYKEKLAHEAYNAVVCINLWGEITREETAR